jgi:hypothetical protein
MTRAEIPMPVVSNFSTLPTTHAGKYGSREALFGQKPGRHGASAVVRGRTIT